MKAAQRQMKIQELAVSQEFLDSDSLSRRLRTSESTVRRDLTEMERRGVLRRVHGGAISLLTRDNQMDFAFLSSREPEEKKRIGKAVAELITDGQTIMVDGGSTVAEVARNLLGRSIQVITNSLPIAEIFYESKTSEVTLTGGYLYPRVGVLLGPICEQTLSGLAADVLIMGIAGVTEEGFTNSNTLIVSTVRKMMEAAQKIIIAADHTKFGRKGMVHLAPLDAVDLIVTDDGLSQEHREMLKKHNIKYITS
jgi:DeoR/GlpR family transcriptional regulator of sugar metabolism